MNLGKKRVNRVIAAEPELDEEPCCQAYQIAIMVGDDPEHDEDCPHQGRGSDFVKYTLVRHRDARNEPQMALGIEVVPVRSPELAQRIRDAGGYLFAEEEAADEVAQSELTAPGGPMVDDGWPYSTGWFDWQVTVGVGKHSEPIYKDGYTSERVHKAAKAAVREHGPSIWNVLHAMRQELGGGTEAGHRLGIQQAGFTIKGDKVK